MSQPSLLDVALIVAAELRRLGIPHLIGGSVASMLHGEPRLTNDVDFAAVMREPHIAPFVQALRGPFYVDEVLIRDAIQRRGMFNVIHIASANRVDVHVLEPDKFQRGQLERAVQVQLMPHHEIRVPVASAEDTVLQKLYAQREGEGACECQLRDVLGVLKLQGGRLDLAYMRFWARDLQLTENLERLLREAGIERGVTVEMA
ncbi:MAG: hypothetical protein ABI054_02760 [Planctomycetota bacterium]